MKSLIVTFAAIAAMQASAFSVTSTDIHEGKTLTQAQVLNGFGCQGKNISPQISWSNPPKAVAYLGPIQVS